MTDKESAELFGGTLLYLQIRDWAFEKMKACPEGTAGLDITVPHYLYFANALAAVDLVDERLNPSNGHEYYKTDYGKSIIAGFESQNQNGEGTYHYVRELRNMIVHRGLDAVAAAHEIDSMLRPICPLSVSDRKGVVYNAPVRYLLELAEMCNKSFNTVIHAELVEHNIYDQYKAQTKSVTGNDILEYLNTIPKWVMPDWARRTAPECIAAVDFEKETPTIADTNIRKMKSLLQVE